MASWWERNKDYFEFGRSFLGDVFGWNKKESDVHNHYYNNGSGVTPSGSDSGGIGFMGILGIGLLLILVLVLVFVMVGKSENKKK